MRERHINSPNYYFRDEETLASRHTEKEMEPETKYGIVCNAKFVRVRTSPEMETTENVIGIARIEDRFEILEELPNFYRINYNGNEHCFISSDFLKEE